MISMVLLSPDHSMILWLQMSQVVSILLPGKQLNAKKSKMRKNRWSRDTYLKGILWIDVLWGFLHIFKGKMSLLLYILTHLLWVLASNYFCHRVKRSRVWVGPGSHLQVHNDLSASERHPWHHFSIFHRDASSGNLSYTRLVVLPASMWATGKEK